ncbi:unnamed protein product [Auanema sp. JU1783]|nr:unnamed protein product [Auanema sp. JU1783]
MPFFDKVINIFRTSGSDDSKRKLPPIIQVNINPSDSWQIISELGDGAFGKVHKVSSKSDKKLLAAAKAIEVQEGEVLEDFLIEIEILTACHHPNVVELYAAYFIENKLHMMLEFCAGGAVDGIMIELEKPLTEPQIRCIAKSVNNALIFLHDNLVIHRDLKAGNILITHDAVIKLADFGVSAKLKHENEKRDTFIGTPYWMAPEVMMCETFKDQPYSTVSDIWSFGITLIEMAQMEPPHSNLSPMRVLIKVQKSEPPTLEKADSFSADFSDFLTKCLKKNPNERLDAKALQSHPFLQKVQDMKPIQNLLAEVNAEVQEEIIEVDEHASSEGSLHDSEDRSEIVFTPDLHPIEENHSKKNAPAPPPPEKPSKDVTLTEIENVSSSSLNESSNKLKLSLVLDDSSSSDPEPIVSPQTQALHILDDLNDALGEDSNVSSKRLDTSNLNSPTIVQQNGNNQQSQGAEMKILDDLNAALSADSKLSVTKENGSDLRSASPMDKGDHSPTADVLRKPTKEEGNGQRRNNEYFDEKTSQGVSAAPPEPPVDYEESMKENYIKNNAGILPPIMKQPGEPRIGGRGNQHRKTVTKKTRVYMIDGMQVTSTTVHILGAKQDLQLKKQQLQDLRRIQREEARQKQELQSEAVLLAEQQDKKFQSEKAALLKQYDFDMESLERKQKKEMEEAEKAQEEEMRQVQKKLKSDREKDLKCFRERLKLEKKFAKQEVDLLPRAQRKEIMKVKQDCLEHECRMKEAEFVLHTQKSSEAALARLAQKHKEAIAQLERNFLVSRHLLLRSRENSDWDLEAKQMGEKFILHRRLLKDEYLLLRSQMLVRHQQELNHVQKIQHEEETEMIRALQADRKKLPKVLRQEAKTRSIMFKESLKIGSQNLTQDELVEKLRRFEETESNRIKITLEEYDIKCNKKLSALKKLQHTTSSELEMMQNEKRKQLLEKEQVTMGEHERKYVEMKEQWEAELVSRKTTLEQQFGNELDAQEKFYGVMLPPLSSSASNTPLLSNRFV